MTFEINEAQYNAYNSWLAEQNKKAIDIQKRETDHEDSFHHIYEQSWRMGFPYCGAIGGEIQWIFIPTSIGDICHVKHSVTKEELDLTELGNFG